MGADPHPGTPTPTTFTLYVLGLVTVLNYHAEMHSGRCSGEGHPTGVPQSMARRGGVR